MRNVRPAEDWGVDAVFAEVMDCDFDSAADLYESAAVASRSPAQAACYRASRNRVRRRMPMTVTPWED